MRTPLLPALLVLFLWGIWPLLAKVSIGRIGLQALLWSQATALVVVGVYLLSTSQLRASDDLIGLLASAASGVVVAAGSVIFYHLLRQQAASIVVFLTGLYPVVTLLIAWLVLHERISTEQMAGIFLAVAALALLTR